MDDKQNKFCVICGGSADESHHIHPQHLGGLPESAQVTLCGSCHAKVHFVANRIYKGKTYDEKPEWLRRAKPLINRIVSALIKAETTNLDDTPTRIILKLSKAKLKLIHRRKIDAGFSSLEKYLTALIDTDLTR